MQVLQLPALATTAIKAPTLDLLQETAQAGRTLMRLLAPMALSGPPALPLQTAVAWNAALARSPPATTTPAPRTQAVVRKQITPPDLQMKVLQPPALAPTVIQAPMLDLRQMTAQAGRTLMQLLAPMALSGPLALPLQTAVAWNAALARSPPATTTPVPRTQAVVRK